MNPEQLAARIWPDQKVELERLGGGITNHNLVTRVNGETYVLRIAGTDTELLGIDRTAEHAAAKIAADLDVGPEVVAFVEGPIVQGSEEELEAIERGYETPAPAMTSPAE